MPCHPPEIKLSVMVMGAKPEHPRLHSGAKAGWEDTHEACVHEASSPHPIFPADGKRLY